MSLEKKKVYIVDDDESVCRSLKILLMTFEFDVTTFNSAKSFFNAVPDDDPGCLVLDIHMPGVNGWAMQKMIFDSGSRRPVIFISADRQEGSSARALNVGALGFLQKPFEGQSLVDLINTAIESNDSMGKIAQ